MTHRVGKELPTALDPGRLVHRLVGGEPEREGWQLRLEVEPLKLRLPGHTLTAAQIRSELERITRRGLTFKRFPWWMFTLAGPVWELARELAEMRYLWETDHALSRRRLETLLLEFRDTPLDEVLRSALPS